MKIALVGPGIMEIPPKGWGAVESLIWDYATELGELGHEGTIINTPDRTQIIRELSEEQYDFIHVHYDVFYDIMDYIWATQPDAKLAISSHYPYIDQPDRHPYDGYDKIYKWLIENDRTFWGKNPQDDIYKKVFAFHNDLLEFPTLSYFRTAFDDETFIKNFKEVCYVEE